MNEALPLGRLVLCVEYDGAAFCGWQRQVAPTPSPAHRDAEGGVPYGHSSAHAELVEAPQVGEGKECADLNQKRYSRSSVQEALETALAAVTDVPVRVTAAGRTDAGVHASAQVAHFDAPVARPLTAWVRGVNAHLSPTVAVRWAQPVAGDFHARFSATARHYTYWLLNRPERPGLWAGRVGWHHRPLDVAAMAAAARHWIGAHDFSSFRAAQCQAKSPVKSLTDFSVTQHGAFVRFACSGNAFLHHMVRNMVGALLWVGIGKRPPEWAAELLEARDRTQAAPTFMADGLYLTGISYDERFGLPSTRRDVCIFDGDGRELT
ncbi:MAG: tRNA pseudouridine(38-40) synthase TruA [Burkholderiales bacterium]|jgi:tRNA pseudouridine38-40 synthase|nr:tRNA pseudouridine(38-40) synthase TruA [Burkholderiales bacterium]